MDGLDAECQSLVAARFRLRERLWGVAADLNHLSIWREPSHRCGDSWIFSFVPNEEPIRPATGRIVDRSVELVHEFIGNLTVQGQDISTIDRLRVCAPAVVRHDGPNVFAPTDVARHGRRRSRSRQDDQYVNRGNHLLQTEFLTSRFMNTKSGEVTFAGRGFAIRNARYESETIAPGRWTTSSRRRLSTKWEDTL